MSERFGPIDFDEFHLVDLPARLASGNAELARVYLDGVRPIAFRLDDGRAYTYSVTDDGIGAAAAELAQVLQALRGTPDTNPHGGRAAEWPPGPSDRPPTHRRAPLSPPQCPHELADPGHRAPSSPPLRENNSHSRLGVAV